MASSASGRVDAVRESLRSGAVLHVVGYASCGYFRRAAGRASALLASARCAVEVRTLPSKPAFFEWLEASFAGAVHTTSPLVFTAPPGAFQTPVYLGGDSDLGSLVDALGSERLDTAAVASTGPVATVRKSSGGGAGEEPPTKRTRSEDGVGLGIATAGGGGSGASDGVLPGEVGDPVLIFVGGDASQVGKSSCCLGLLGALLEMGYSTDEVAYIKPATQCEAPQLIGKYAATKGIKSCPIGPIVYYSGFTRAFVSGKLGTSQDWLQRAVAAVRNVGKEAKVTVVDGVGYPAVGSICGLSNADVAQALKASVLIVGRSGVGNAVDSFNQNATFFESRGVQVLGGVFNRLAMEGYYALDKCKAAVTEYFGRFKPHQLPYGFLPEIEAMIDRSPPPPKPSTAAVLASAAASTGDTTPKSSGGESLKQGTMSEAEASAADLMIRAFIEHVDTARLLADAAAAKRGGDAPTARRPSESGAVAPVASAPVLPTRAELEAQARASGASGG